MIKTEFLIIGQGISGTFVSWYLQKAGHDIMVIDDNDSSSSSRVAAGIINPITGRRIVRTWMIDTLLPFAMHAYENFGRDIDAGIINRKSTIEFFPTAQIVNAFTGRINDNDDFLSAAQNPDLFTPFFNYDFGYGTIDPCFLIDMRILLTKWRSRLQSKSLLLNEHFEENRLEIRESGIEYKEIKADKVIYCDGVHAANSRWFRNLPFALNKGEALIIECDLPQQHIYKKTFTLAPLGDNLFWAGSSHQWDYSDALPSDNFYKTANQILGKWIKQPFRVVSHMSAIRPATVERRPFVGVHPHLPRIAILNGMGTKGCSLAPYFAHQLVRHLTENTPILPEANISRFSRILKPN